LTADRAFLGERYRLVTNAKNLGQISKVTFWNKASASPITEVSYPVVSGKSICIDLQGITDRTAV
jgi:hypothetical protein